MKMPQSEKEKERESEREREVGRVCECVCVWEGGTRRAAGSSRSVISAVLAARFATSPGPLPCHFA